MSDCCLLIIQTMPLNGSLYSDNAHHTHTPDWFIIWNWHSVQQIIPHLCSWLAVLCSWVVIVVTIAGTLLLYCKQFHSREPGFPHGGGGTWTTWQTRSSKKEKKHCFCILHTYIDNYSTWFIDCWVLFGIYPINVSSVSHRMAMYQCSLTELWGRYPRATGIVADWTGPSFEPEGHGLHVFKIRVLPVTTYALLLKNII